MLLSKNNPRIKYIRRLGNRRFREKEGKFLVEGVRFLEEALRERWPLEYALYVHQAGGNPRGAQVLDMLAKQGVPLLAVDKALFAELAETESPQGIMAVAQMPRRPGLDPAVLNNAETGLLVLVDGVRDPGNLGTIIRCADAYGAGGVILLKGTVDPFNPKTLRATMGAVFRVPLLQVDNPDCLPGVLQSSEWKVVAGDPAAERHIHNCDLSGRVIVAVGGEAAGFSEQIERFFPERVSIPMPGRAESLNAGVAACVMMYEAVRQRVYNR